MRRVPGSTSNITRYLEPGRIIEYYRARWVTGGSNPRGVPAEKSVGIEPLYPSLRLARAAT